MNQIHPKILQMISTVTAKRARAVIDKIVENGFVTTEELENMGYAHAPRAARDVRELGIPLETFKVKKSGTDKSIAAYRFGDPDKIENFKFQGRLTFSKQFKNDLLEAYGSKCAISNEQYEPIYLQIDHRIPYEIAGNQQNELDVANFMLLSGSAQRQKSWECEKCQNFVFLKRPDICCECYWAFPEGFSHIAMQEMRNVLISLIGNEVSLFDNLVYEANTLGISVQELIKRILYKYYNY